MDEFFRRLFDTSDFPPRWHCGTWSEGLGWLHICSDVVIWLAYMGIPVGIFLIVYRKRDLPFPRLFWLFGAFIAFCGIGHLLEAMIFWWPAYRLAGVVKLITAAVSIATMIVALFELRRLMQMPTAKALMADLQRERSEANQRIEELFRSAFNSAPCGMLLADAKGMIVLANDQVCRLFGFGANELVGRPIAELVPIDAADRVDGPVGAGYRDGATRAEASGRELTVVRRDGGEVVVEVRLNPVQLATGPAVISTIVDVSSRIEAERERKRYAEELERRNAALDEFAYLVSHDLKAPLRAVSLVSSWLLEDFGERLGEEGAEHLRTIRERVIKMDALIGGALSYARAAREQGDLERLDSREVVDEVLAMIEVPHGASLSVTTALPTLCYERNHLTKILLNLISNAFTNGGEGCVVEIACEERPDEFVFRVTDDGPGIASEHHERIFRMFQRLPGSAPESTGVGLAIVKTLVERHGGRVRVDSALGSGATFSFTVPRDVAITSDTAREAVAT